MILFEELIDQYAIVETLAKFLNFQDIQNLLFVDKQSLFSFRHFDNKIDAEYPVLKKWKKSENAIRTFSKNYPKMSFWSPWTWKSTKGQIVHFPILGVIARLWFAPQLNEVYLELSSNHIKSTVFIPTPSNEAFDLSIISTNMLLISASPVQDNRILNISDIIETQTIKWLLYDEISPASIQSQYHNWSLCRNYYHYLCYSVMRGHLIDLLTADGKVQLSLPIDKILSDWREKQHYAIEKLYLQIFNGMNMISLGARISKCKDEKRMLCFLLQRKNGSDYVWELLENFLLLNDFQVFDNDCVPVYCQIFKRFEILTTNGQPISEIRENKIY